MGKQLQHITFFRARVFIGQAASLYYTCIHFLQLYLFFLNTNILHCTTLMFVMDMMLRSSMDSQNISWFRDFGLLAFKLMSYFAAWIKMGDYYWYGLQGERNTTAAAEMYANAALGGDPHVCYLRCSCMVKTRFDNFVLLKSIILTRKSCQLSFIEIQIFYFEICINPWKSVLVVTPFPSGR